VTKDGQPVECFLTPGSYSDVRMLKAFQFDVPEGSHIYADKAYHDDAMEDVLLEASHIQLYPIRQKNSTRILPPYLTYIQHDYRKRIETVGSLIERMLPKTIHAVTAEGFELKVFLFVMAYSINCLEIATWVKLGKTHERFHGVWCGILQGSPVCMGIKTPNVQEVTPWSHVSPLYCNA
jgi:hypothetical protein